MASDALRLRGLLKGHTGSVTCLTTASDNPDFLLSGSRDCTLLLWNITKESAETYGAPKRRLFGHGHFVQDVVISVDGQFALSGSWDSTLRLWELQNGTNTRTFVGHNKDVLSVAFSSDNRQIVSASRDKTIKLWNTLGDCKYTMEENGHSDWVSCVRFSPNPQNPIIVSGGWDKKVKVWNLTTCKLVTDLTGHTGYVNTVTISPDGSLCASGGRDGMVRLWDLNEGKHLYALEAKDTVNALCFSPTRYWLCAGTNSGLKIWDLESKDLVADITSASEGFGASVLHPDPTCNCLSWSNDGSILYAGYSDHVVRVWEAPK